MNWLVIYPEIWLLAAVCAIAIIDLFVTDPGRGPTFWLTQLSVGVYAYMHLVHYAGGGSIRDWSRSLERARKVATASVSSGSMFATAKSARTLRPV